MLGACRVQLGSSCMPPSMGQWVQSVAVCTVLIDTSCVFSLTPRYIRRCLEGVEAATMSCILIECW